MSIREAARTSILSRKWRYVWSSIPQLVFDKNFFNEIKGNHPQFIQYEFPKAINKVFFVHNGPIIKFFLHIPNIPYDLSLEIDQWMLFLTRNGIKKIEISNNNNPTLYILPSCVFSCPSLLELKVHKCIMKPPYEFEGFRYLVDLQLLEILFSANVSATFLQNTPLLKELTIFCCTGIETRNIYAPRLTNFTMLDRGEVDWEWVVSNKQLTNLQIRIGREVKNVEQTFNMMKFLSDLPKLKALWLNGFSLKYLAAGNLSKSLARPRLQCASAPFLKRVLLHNIGVDDLDQISSTLCLLKNCPNLKILELYIATSTNNAIEPVTEYLESFNCMDLRLDKLQTVDIKFMRGLKPELLLVKILLSRSTCLQRMTIKQSTEMSASDGFKISRDLLGFPRASLSANIIYVDLFSAK